MKVSTPLCTIGVTRTESLQYFAVNIQHTGIYKPTFLVLKFMFSKKATKFDEIFIVDLTLTTYCQIDGKDFVNFVGLLRKHEL